MKIFQKGFNYSQDGVGNRLVYHLQGCNMCCTWCSNPEGLAKEGVLITDEEWLLDSVCPHGAIHDAILARERCKGCGDRSCITQHRTKGIRLSCQEQSVSDIVQEVKRNSAMFYDGGGVTFTGGEATLQFEELAEVLSFLHAVGIHTAIETNGTHPRLWEYIPFVDQFIMDLKLCDNERHKVWTGVSNQRIKDNIRRIANGHPCVHIRVPLIGGVNVSRDDREAFLQFFESVGGDNVTFEVLSYHEYGKLKWKQCGLEYQMTGEAYVNAAIVRHFIADIRERGLSYQAT